METISKSSSGNAVSTGDTREKTKDSPRRSSPKFPQPIFLPTRKFGPTMSTPDDEVTLCRDECTFDRAALPLPLEVRLATSWSRSEPRAPSSLSPRLSLPSRFCISYRPLLSTVATIQLSIHDPTAHTSFHHTRGDDDGDVSFGSVTGIDPRAGHILRAPREARG